MRGSFAPQKSSMTVISAAVTREDCMRSTLWSWDMPARADRMIAGVTDPTIMAKRCWTAMGME